jgi:hypothetical protein
MAGKRQPVGATVKISFQGGIKAVNGFQNVFMVTSVQAVTTLPKLNREETRLNSADSGNSNKKKTTSSFASVFEQAKENYAERSYETTTYGRDSMLHTELYQSREYTYSGIGTNAH